MRKLLTLTVLVALVGVLPASAVDFTTYVALGDSLTAGYTSLGLVHYYQTRSFPALLAQQGGSPVFEMPLVSDPGIEPLLYLAQLYPGPVILPVSDTPGMPVNAETTGDIYNLLAGNTDNAMHDLILRFPEAMDPSTGEVVPAPAIAQAIALNPTFVTMWIGNSDILGTAIYATPIEGVTMTPVETFEQLYQTALGALATYTSADIVVATIPSVTAIPFTTSIDPFITLPGGAHVPLIGSNGLLPPDAMVTLGASSLLAQGIGIPVELGGTGQPLPEDLQIVGAGVIPGVVLRAEEVAIITDRTDAFNDIIRETAAAFGAHVVDMNEIFGSLVEEPWVFGGISLSADFLTGGIFSYDAVHPQNIGYGLVAVEFINLINAELITIPGQDIPQVDMNEIIHEGGYMPGAKSAQEQPIFSAEAMEQLMESFPLLRPVVSVKPLREAGSLQAER